MLRLMFLLKKLLRAVNGGRSMKKQKNVKQENKMNNIGLYFIFAGVIVLFGAVLFSLFSSPNAQSVPSWKSIVDEKDGISVEVNPLKLSHTENSEFRVTFTTHQGSLDFDPDKISVLQDNNGKKYLPLKWDGSPAGGHHRSGTLIFPKLDDNALEVKLNLKVGKSERIFEWSLH